MFLKQVPEELKPEVSKVVIRNKGSNQFDKDDLTYLMTIQYRYLTSVSSEKTIQQRVTEDMRCNRRKAKTQLFFKEMVESWGQIG